jgi:pimeloyl-ACP methyl ester carboxylesterase
LLAFYAANAGFAAEKAELKRHTVMSDGHPMALWEKSAGDASEAILLVHGRTWSALPDFDLRVEGEDLSLMDGLVAEGYDDLANVVEWIASSNDWALKPHLFGWSYGSTHAQLMVQRHPGLVASLTLFGYWRDDDVDEPADELNIAPARERNTAEFAASDFITPGSISRKAIDAYVAQSLEADPVRVDFRHLDQFNALDATLIDIPTLVIAGEFDPLGPAEYQSKLYTRLATGHKQWVTVPGADHAAFLESPRAYFIHELVSFLQGVSPNKHP